MIIKAITDNGGLTADNFTIYFFDDSYLSLSRNCDSLQGVSQFGTGAVLPEQVLIAAAQSDKMISECEKLINFYDLPKHIQKHVILRLKEAQNDCPAELKLPVNR